MEYGHSVSGFQPLHVLQGCKSIDQGHPTFVDIGGSKGHVSIVLAKEHANINFIVQDSAKTVAIGRQEVPDEVKDRISFTVHDFWTEQPVKGAEVYLFRQIFHDWSDKYAVKILRNLIPALKTGARIIISDMCMPPKGTISVYKERWLR